MLKGRRTERSRIASKHEGDIVCQKPKHQTRNCKRAGILMPSRKSTAVNQNGYRAQGIRFHVEKDRWPWKRSLTFSL